MEEKTITAIKLTVNEADELLKYLANKPYVEVARLIDMIQKSEKIFSE